MIDWPLLGRILIALVGLAIFIGGIMFFLLRRLYKAIDTLFKLEGEREARITMLEKTVLRIDPTQTQLLRPHR